MKPKEVFRGGYGCVPRQMHTAWQRVSYLARAIGRDLIAHIDDFGSMRLQISGEWRSSLCLLLQVNGGNDRRSAKLALDQLAAAGLITVGDGFVTIHLTPAMRPACAPDDAGMSPACARDVAGVSSSCAAGVFESNQDPENTQVTSDSKQAIEASKLSDARARPDLFGFNWYCQVLSLLPTSAPAPGSWREQYAWIGSKPDAERAKVAAELQADAWCSANKHLVTPEHVRKHWQKYLGGAAKPVLKPVVATPREQLDKAKERLRAAFVEVNRLDGLPWFDREKPSWPARRERAQAELTAAGAALAVLERGASQAVAS